VTLTDSVRAGTVAGRSKRLVIAEKASVATDIARALSGAGERFTRSALGFESDTWIITAARGHLVAEADPDQYDERYKRWTLEDLPILPPRVLYKPRDPSAGQLLRTLEALIERPDVTELVNACDAGREGELIFKLITQYARTTKPITRAWFSSMTATAILGALRALRPDSVMKPLEAAARCRAEADWLVGINATRAATVHLGRSELLSVGRVQTPTLALVVRRDLEIANFVPRDYFQLTATLAHPAVGEVAAGRVVAWHVTRHVAEPASGTRPTSRAGKVTWTLTTWDERAAVDAVIAVLTGADGRVLSCETTTETSGPPRLFDLTALQQVANTIYGYSAARTLTAAQACYETHKCLSYPRTDSTYITTDLAPQIPALVEAVAAADPALVAAVAAIAARVTAGEAPAARLVDDQKVTDHHALLPTLTTDLSGLSQTERRIYDLVARRFLAAQLPAAVFARRTLLMGLIASDTSKHVARATSRTRTNAGWQAVFPGPGIGRRPAEPEERSRRDTAEQDDLLPDLPASTPVAVTGCETVAKKTAPASHYNDATLLGAMASAGRLVTDEELSEAMKRTGLGTPATRAAILERLVEVGYLERKGRAIRAAAKAISFIGILGDHPLVHPDLTGAWEARLRTMERATPGSEARLREAFLADVRTFTGEIVAGVAALDTTGFNTPKVLGPCPIRGCTDGEVVERQKSWSCSSYRSRDDPGCGYAIFKVQNGKRITQVAARRILAEAPAALPARVQAIPLMPCGMPRCKGSVVERPTSFSCSSWSPRSKGCGLTLWKSARDGSVLVSRENLAAKMAEFVAAARARRTTRRRTG
jgi:DNA topoisomerase III